MGAPSLNILVGGAFGYAVIGLVIVAILRPRRMVGFAAILIMCCVALRLTSSLRSLAHVEPLSLAGLVLKQIAYSGLSSSLAFVASGAFWDRREAEAPRPRLYK